MDCRNPNDRTKQLHPVQAMSEQLSDGRYYAFGWGGGLPADSWGRPVVIGDTCATEAAAFASLEAELRKHGRRLFRRGEKSV